jgi:hypothetical protein
MGRFHTKEELKRPGAAEMPIPREAEELVSTARSHPPYPEAGLLKKNAAFLDNVTGTFNGDHVTIPQKTPNPLIGPE